MATTAAPHPQARNHGYQLFMLALCVLALLALAVDHFFQLSPQLDRLVHLADFGVCVLFFFDFVYMLATAPNRTRYLLTWGWIDLLSAVPTVDALRIGRAARIMRIFRVLRGAKAARVVSSAILERRAESVLLAVSLVTLLLLVLASAAILGFEDVPAANIKGPEDALWWAFVTITTVGYGDRFPVTWEGRLVGALLMAAGVGLFGTFSGFVASWFLAPRAAKNAGEIELLRQELAALREEIRAAGLSGRPERRQ